MTWKKFQITIWILLAVCAGGVALFVLAGSTGLMLKISPTGFGRIISALILLFLLLLFVWGDGAVARSTRSWARGVALTFAAAVEGLFLAVFLFFLVFFDCGTQFVPLEGPEGQPTLVAMEESWLQGGWGSFYWCVGPGWLRYTGVDYITDDAYRPFEYGDYELEWGENSVTVRFDTSAGWDYRVVDYPAK